MAASVLRRNVRESILLGLLLAVVLATVLAAVAGARRTDAAIGDFVQADKGAAGYAAFNLPNQGPPSPNLVDEAAAVQAVDGVVHTGRFTNAIVEVSGPNVPTGREAVAGDIGIDPGGLAMVSRFHYVDGGPLDESKVDEVLIDEELARDARLALGSRLHVRAYTPDQLDDVSAPAAGFGTDAEVVGIVRRPTDLRDPQSRQLQPNDYVVQQDVYLTSAFWAASGGNVAGPNPMVAFDVADGVDLGTVLKTVTEATSAYVIDHDRFLELDGTYKGVARSASLHSRGLQAFAALVALAGLFLIGQTLGRQVVLESRDNPTLLALGMTPRQLVGAAILRMGPVAVAGVLAGAIGAIALSPLTPLPGTVARRADLHPGLSVDVTVLVLGCLVAALVAIAIGSVAAIRTLRRSAVEDQRRARPTLASRLTARGRRAPAIVGVRFALEPGRGHTAVPVRAAIAAAVATVALMLAAIVFSASLADSRHRPERFGVTWDVAAGSMSDPGQAAALADQVRAIPGVRAFAGLATTAFDTSFGEIPTVMVRQERGTVMPLITAGHAPGPGEVALGAVTMREQGLAIGDDFEISDVIAGRRTFTISGVAVLNVAGVDVSIPPGKGALFDWSMLAMLDPDNAASIAPEIFLVDAEPGRLGDVTAALTALFPTSTRAQAVAPLDLANLGDASILPTALGAVVAVLGIATVTHALLSTVRRRRHELGVLKALGFVRSDVRRTMAWQSATFGLIAVVVGIPLGLAGGRAAWHVAAEQLGIPSHPVVTARSIALLVAAVGAVLLLVVILPARRAGRIRPADLLRQE